MTDNVINLNDERIKRDPYYGIPKVLRAFWENHSREYGHDMDTFIKNYRRIDLRQNKPLDDMGG